MKKILSLILMLSLIVVLTACSSKTLGTSETTEVSENFTSSEADSNSQEQTESKGSENAHYPVTIKNFNYGKESIDITFDKEPEKVFAVYQDSIETLLALGLEDKIVACAGLDQDVKDEYKEAFSKVNYLTEFSPDKESVLMLEPDFILSWYSYFSEKKLGDVNYWHSNDINTYIMMNSGAAPERTLENEYEDIINLGIIFDVEDKANEIVNEIKSEVNSIVESASKLEEKPRVLVMETEKDGIRVYGDNTLGGDMVNKLGAELVIADENRMSSEALIESNPDVIFTVYFGSSTSVADEEAAVAKLTEDPKYASLKAVKEGRVYAISLGEMYCSGTRTLDGIIKLADGIYPEFNK